MADDTGGDPVIMPPPSPASSAQESARLAWESAIARCSAAHRAAVLRLDQSFGVTLRNEGSASGATSQEAAALADLQDLKDSLLTRMENRMLHLADAMQMRAIVNVFEAHAAIDDIADAAAQAIPAVLAKDAKS